MIDKLIEKYKQHEELKKQINTLNIEIINAPNIVITQIMKIEIIGVDIDE